MKNLQWSLLLSLLLLGGLILIACTRQTEPAPTPSPTYEEIGALFSNSSACSGCHNNQPIQDTERTASLSEEWATSLMAASALDPYFLASVSKESLLYPEQAFVIEDTCATCHMPMARTEDVLLRDQSGAILDRGYLHNEHPLHDLAMNGVSCAICHQIENVNLNNEFSFTGMYVIDPDVPQNAKPAYGPYPVEESLADYMRFSSNYAPIKSSHIQTPELCATCHTLFTTPITPDGGRSSETFPEQVPYLEWEASSFNPGTTCQDCHMPELTNPVQLSNTGGPFRSGYSTHSFTSANTFMLTILQSFNDALTPQASPDHYAQALLDTQAFLAENVLGLHVTGNINEDKQLFVTVQITSQVGHKFPSGYPSRRAWLHLKAIDVHGNVVFESGEYESNGFIPDNANDRNPTAFEPHYEVITKEDQVQIYEAIMTGLDQIVTTDLLGAAAYVKDNRLLPEGFDKTRVFEAVAVQGQALGDPDFAGGGDTIRYQIPMTEWDGPVTIRVAMLFQPVGFRWIENFRPFNTPLIAQFLSFADAAGVAPALIYEETIQISPAP
jgi:hypothetical protein